jgi:hypothetical protein
MSVTAVAEHGLVGDLHVSVLDTGAQREHALPAALTLDAAPGTPA